jgi:hypothetical protein
VNLCLKVPTILALILVSSVLSAGSEDIVSSAGSENILLTAGPVGTNSVAVLVGGMDLFGDVL